MNKNIRKILIVDDEFEFCKTIQRHLKRAGFLTDYDAGGTEAYQKVQNSFKRGSPFDLMIIDISMLLNDGIEISQKIIKDYSSVSILFITACSDFDLVKKIMRPNIDAHNKKPLTPQKMIKLIDNIDRKRNS